MNLRRFTIIFAILFTAFAFFILPENFNPLFILLFIPIVAMGIKFWDNDFKLFQKK